MMLSALFKVLCKKNQNVVFHRKCKSLVLPLGGLTGSFDPIIMVYVNDYSNQGSEAGHLQMANAKIKLGLLAAVENDFKIM